MNKMPMLPFLLLTTLGASIWSTLLTLVGYYLEQNYEAITTMLAPYSKIFLVLTAVIMLGWFIKRRLTA